jgi:hypothetical protein
VTRYTEAIKKDNAGTLGISFTPELGGRKSRQERGSRGLLVKNLLSDNLVGVKQFSSTLPHALIKERHFALVEAVAFALPTWVRL